MVKALIFVSIFGKVLVIKLTMVIVMMLMTRK